MQKLGNPIPFFYDIDASPLTGGRVYIGVADADPETNPIDVFWDAALTIAAEQPLRTIAGMIVNGVTPALAFVDEDDWSVRVRNSDLTQVTYSPSAYSNSDAFQPISPELTAIAALTTTPFGRSLLTLANTAALAAATGIPTPLPAAGGTVNGNIIRQGAGGHLYHAASGMPNGPVFLTQAAASDPRTAGTPGQMWAKYL